MENNIVKKFIKWSKEKRFIQVFTPVVEYKNKVIAIKCFKIKDLDTGIFIETKRTYMEIFPLILEEINNTYDKKLDILMLDIEFRKTLNENNQPSGCIILRCASENDLWW